LSIFIMRPFILRTAPSINGDKSTKKTKQTTKQHTVPAGMKVPVGLQLCSESKSPNHHLFY
jgi:hypothetical protein